MTSTPSPGPPSSAPDLEHSHSGKGHLLRVLGVTFGIAVVVGGTVGSGILRTPGEIAAQLRSPFAVMAVWIVGGIYALFGTAAVSELGTMIPETGGWFKFVRHAFGDYTAFMVGSCEWVVVSAASAYLAVAFAEFFCALFPFMHGNIKLAAAGILIVLAVINWIGVRSGSRAQELTTALKALALLAFVVACFTMSSPHTETSAPTAMSSSWLLPLVIAMQAIIITYDGWYGAIYFSGEDPDPARNLPRSSLLGVIACAVIYLLINAALLHALPFPQLMASQMPAVDAANNMFGSHGSQVVLIISVITTLSAINATLMETPRIVYGLSQEGFLPGVFQNVTLAGTPAPALALCTIVAVVLALSGSYEKLIALASFLFVTVYLFGFSSLYALRRKRPDWPRPFRMWGYPWSLAFIIAGSAAFLISTILRDLKSAVFTLILLVLTYPTYRWLVVPVWMRRRE